METLRRKVDFYTWLLLALILLGALIHPIAFAALNNEDAIFPEIAVSGRALAMGNAFVAGVDDSMSAFYNPAGFGSVRWFHLHLSNFMFEWNKNMMDMGTGGNMSNIASNIGKVYAMDGMRELQAQDKYREKIAHTRAQAYPNLTSRYFGLGYVLSQKVRSVTGKDPGGQFEYFFRRDHGPVGSLDLSLFGGIFKLGLMTSYLNRTEIKGEQSPLVSYEENNSNTYKGAMLYGLLGTKLTLPYTFLPTFAAKWNNFYHSHMHKTGGGGIPTTPAPTVDLGFSISPQFAKLARIHLEVDYKDVGYHFNDVSSTRRLCAGMEIDIARRFFLRGGWGDGFGSGGIGLKTPTLEVDLTTYAVDLTSSQFKGKEDRRFAFGLSYGF